MSYFLSLKGLSKNSYSRTKFGIGNETNRQMIINIIDDFIQGNDFEHHYFRWYCEENSLLKKEALKKIYNPLGYMKKISNEMILLSPKLVEFNTIKYKKLKVLKKVLSENKWNSLNQEIYKTQENKGDFFAYWYYPEGTTIPKIKVLESERIQDIILDREGNPTKYVYKEVVVDEDIDETNANVISRDSYEITMVFAKGYIRVNDPKKYKDTGFRIFPNKKWEEDIIRLIHVPTFKNQKDKFSSIPAVDYIDNILLLNAITTDIRYINRLAGFPIAWLKDAEIDDEISAMMPGGKVHYNSISDGLEKRDARVDFQEIRNDLATLRQERELTESSLYKLSGLIREKLEEILSRSDSSRVIAQLRLTLEAKFEKYCSNIAEAFKPIFKSVLIANNLYSVTEEDITFKMPDQFINTSILERLEILNTKIALGGTTMQEEWDKEGLSKQEQTIRKKNINEEVVLGKDDVRINEGSISSDNKLKQETNVVL
jgi:hypothetical protein